MGSLRSTQLFESAVMEARGFLGLCVSDNLLSDKSFDVGTGVYNFSWKTAEIADVKVQRVSGKSIGIIIIPYCASGFALLAFPPSELKKRGLR